MKHITFLGPVGATFSHDAYNILAELYGAPKVVALPTETNCVPADSNGEILKLIIRHGGYGAIAMETFAKGRVAEPLESFIELLLIYPNTMVCPFRIIGAIRMKIHFCLMVRDGLSESEITQIITHPKSIDPCRERIAKMNIPTVPASSNGEAARLVAENNEYARSAALGPKCASEKYGLKVLHGAFEDGEAVTTFFLIAPVGHGISTGKENRTLIVFKLPHRPGALVRALVPFEREGLNLVQIHSVHAGNHAYNFAIEVDVKNDQLAALERAMKAFDCSVDAHLPFGPFEVLSR